MFRAIILIIVVLWANSVLNGQASDREHARRDAEMEKRLELLERRIVQLESLLKKGGWEPAQDLAKDVPEPPPAQQAPNAPTAAPTTAVAFADKPMAEVISDGTDGAGDYLSRELRMPVSGYMDYHFNKPEDQPGIADMHRFVLLFGHSFNDRIQFWSELELEHALVEGGEESGELELEQAYLDFRVKPWLNFRGGVMLAPVGMINERHEPPMFNGVERPFVDTVILPSTWFEPGFGIHGDLGKGFVYKAYMMSPLNASQFDAGEGIRGGRQKAFESVTQNPAVTGRLEYHGLPGLSLGGSFWTGKSGFATPGINPRVNVFEFDGRFSLGRFDFRGEFAQVSMDQTAQLNLLLQRTTGISPNIAERMRGYYWETAYHLLPRRFRHDMVAFSRYENFDTQNKMASGFLPLKEFDRDAFVSGITYFPEPDVALKFDYSILRNRSSFIRARDSLNLGIGWWF